MRRSDDNEEALRKRLQAYHEQTKPLVDFYQRRGIHTAVNAAQPAHIVFALITATFSAARSKDKVLFL